jgi:alkyl hydroperoxide reductase subunit F
MFSLDAPTEVEGVVDVLIIGAGPAGMTSAVYLARKRRPTAIVTRDLGGQMAWTLGIENYMGYQYITGRELTSKFEEQVRQFPMPIVMDDVTELSREEELFTVKTAGERTIQSRTVIVASGKRQKELGVPNERMYVGKGLSYCATCDGPLFSKLDVAIAGGGNSAVQAAVEMGQVAGKVYIVSRNPLRADAIVVEKADKAKNLEKRIGYEILEVLGQDKVEGLRIKDRAKGDMETLRVQGVFVEIGLAPNTSFLKDVVELNQYGEIVVDQNCHTSVPGLFAAGDVTMVHEKQIVVAAGEGAKAALSAHEYLLKR